VPSTVSWVRPLSFAVAVTLFMAVALFAPSTARAGTGGPCPTTAQYVDPTNPTGPLVTLASLGLTSCYYAAANGSDSNDGLSEAPGHPWQHFPQMPNCTASCKAVAATAGEGFIFRGGDTWHYFTGSPQVGLPSGWPTGSVSAGTGAYAWEWTKSGTAANLIYIGVDKNWFTGGAWARPIFTGDNATFLPSAPSATDVTTTSVPSCAFPQGNLDFIAFTGPSFYVLDNIEFTGMCWNDSSTNSSQTGTNEHNYIKHFQGGGSGTNPHWFINIYMHGWSHTAAGCPAITAATVAAGGSGYAVNDTGFISGSGIGASARYVITSVSGGAVTAFTVTQGGTDYPEGSALPATEVTTTGGAQPGSGTGFKVTITATAVTGACGGPGGWYGATNTPNTGAYFFFNVCDGSDSDDLSWECIQNEAYDVEENVFRHFAGTTILNNCHTLHDNLFEFINNDGTGGLHTDVWFCVGETAADNFFYNNLVRNIATEYEQTGVSAYTWLTPAAGFTDYFYNNVFHDDAFGADGINLGQSIGSSSNSQILIYNNTIEVAPTNGNPNLTPFGNTSFPGQITSRNNHYITNDTNGAAGCGRMFTGTANVNGGVTSCSGDVFQTIAAANAQGYTSAGDFAPTAASTATIGTGTNEIAEGSAFGPAFLKSTTNGCAYDSATHTVECPAVTANPRPSSGPWDVGAYQHCDGGCVAPEAGAPDGGSDGGVAQDASANHGDGAGGGEAGSNETPAESKGCGCRAAGQPGRLPGGWALFAFVVSCGGFVLRRIRLRRECQPL
jgi:hypothetical protein